MFYDNDNFDDMNMNRDIYDDGNYKTSAPPHKRTNVLLVRRPLGGVPVSTRSLPGPGHTYGYMDAKDDEGAADVVGSWQQHTRASEQVPGKDFVRLNKYATMSGAVSSKNVSVFRRVTDIRLGESAVPQQATAHFPDSSSVFGRPSPSSVPMADLLTNAYQRRYIAEQRVAKAHQSNNRTRRPQYALSQHTKASLGHTKVPAPPPKAMFKLRQFQNVPARVDNNNYDYNYNAMAMSMTQPRYGRRAESAPGAGGEQIMAV